MHESTVSAFTRVKNLIGSKKLAITLIAVIAVLSSIGMLVPQVTLDEARYHAWALGHPQLVPIIESVGMHKLFQSWWFGLVGVIFLANLSVCTIDQTVRALRAWRKRRALPNVRHGRDTGIPTSLEPQEIAARLQEHMADRGYRYRGGSATVFTFSKGDLGIWGSSVFHWGLILVTIGALATATASMSGYMMIGSGETRYELHDYYDSVDEGPLVPESVHKGYAITLNKLRPVLTEDGKLDYNEAYLTLSDKGTTFNEAIDYGAPLIYRGTAFYYDRVGFAPLCILERASADGDKPVFRSYVMLLTEKIPGAPKGRLKYHIEDFALPGTGLKMDLEFFPDAVVRQNSVTSKSPLMNNPHLKVSLGAGDKATKALLKPGESVAYGDYTLTFGDVNQWVGFNVVKDPGANILFAGFIMASVGLVVLFLVVYRKVHFIIVQDENDTVRLSMVKVTTKYSKMFNEEVDTIIEGLKGALASRDLEVEEKRIGV